MDQKDSEPGPSRNFFNGSSVQEAEPKNRVPKRRIEYDTDTDTDEKDGKKQKTNEGKGKGHGKGVGTVAKLGADSG